MNIKSNFIITCERAFLTAGSNNLNLIEIFSQINTVKFPFNYPRFALVVNFDVDQLGLQKLETEVVGPDGVVLAKAQMEMNITSTNFQVITNFENLTFSVPGKYELKVSIAGVHAGLRVLNVAPVVSNKPNLA